MNFILNSVASSPFSGKPYLVLLPIGLILLLGKVLSLLMGKIKVPEVIGYLLAGLLVGLFYFIPQEYNVILNDSTVGGINFLAKIGVVLILFSAGVETNLKTIKTQGKACVVITLLGVLLPLALGCLCAFLFRVVGHMDSSFYATLEANNIHPFFSDLYYGVILTATSVSITVAALKELGKLEGAVGTALVSSAILDDVIGIVLLSVILALSGGKEGTSFWVIPIGEGPLSVVWLILIMIAFFGLSIGLGFVLHRLFDWMGNKYPHHRRIPMFSLAFCFLWAFLAEIFHIADITGAYIAGLILSNTSAAKYIDHRADTTANIIFAPVFFASVALKMYQAFGLDGSGNGIAGFDGTFLAFGLTWVLVGLLTKFLGAGSGALLSGFKLRDSSAIGIGMMARAEVLIVTAQVGVDNGLVDSSIIAFTLGLIIISSFLAPILLRLHYKNDQPLPPSRPLPSSEKTAIKTN
ncbi:MAG: cation:proton antiporter [Candidatus Enteromonas sp.]|nr:cation:proton antiporter [Candidatus Enteromonas sp.]